MIRKPRRVKAAPRFDALESRTLLSLDLASWVAGFGSLAVDPGSYSPDRILVRYRSDAAAARQTDPMPVGATMGQALSLVPGLREVELPGGVGVQAALAAFEADPQVLYAEPDYRVSAMATPDDPRFAEQWGLNNTGQQGGTPDADIDAPEAWDVTTGGNDALIAVIDTGVDYNHPDLAANMWHNPADPLDGVDNDGNGIVDDYYGADFVNNDGDPMDDYGHGTHVAGILGAAGDNGVGVTGINWGHVKIMALKFLDATGSGNTSAAIAALSYAVDHGATISNNSWGGGGGNQSLHDAIQGAAGIGHILVAAAGNDGVGSPSYPAAFDLPNIVSVAATDRNDHLAAFSNWSPSGVDLGATGVDILSTVPTAGVPLGDPSGYRTLSGTSMATPHVAGVVALVRGLHPDWPYARVIDQVVGTADPVASLAGKVATGGRLNAAGALAPGPWITASTPSRDVLAPVSSVRVTFSEPMDAGSFTTADVSFTGPGGPIAVTGVDPVAGSDRQFDVTFAPQSALGNYRMVIGPAILSQGSPALPMNQDHDRNPGETPDDRYAATFRITNTLTFASDDVPAPIPWYGGVISYLNIPDDLTIRDLNVNLDITQPWDVDLGIRLVSPGGASIRLWNHNYSNGYGADFRGTTFDDEAAVSINQGSPPFTGSYRPVGSLATVDGSKATGTWQLVVQSLPYSGFLYNGGTINSWSLTVEGSEPPPPPTLSIDDVTLVEGDSGQANARFTVSLANATGAPVTVDYATADGTATSPGDYAATSGTLSFSGSTTTRTIDVPVNGDTLDEIDESFLVNLTNPTGATIADGLGVGTIIDDDPPAPTLSDGGFEVPEAGPSGVNGSYLYRPTGTAWAYAGTAGVAADGSGFTAGNPSAPEGDQVGFLQKTGSISQSVSVAAGAAGGVPAELPGGPARQPAGGRLPRLRRPARRRRGGPLPAGRHGLRAAGGDALADRRHAHRRLRRPEHRRRRQHLLPRRRPDRPRQPAGADALRRRFRGARGRPVGGERLVPLPADGHGVGLRRHRRRGGRRQRLHRRQPVGARGRPGRLPPEDGLHQPVGLRRRRRRRRVPAELPGGPARQPAGGRLPRLRRPARRRRGGPLPAGRHGLRAAGGDALADRRHAHRRLRRPEHRRRRQHLLPRRRPDLAGLSVDSDQAPAFDARLLRKRDCVSVGPAGWPARRKPVSVVTPPFGRQPNG